MNLSITRRGFVKTGGALFVTLATAAPAVSAGIDPALLSSWIEIRTDNSILLRTGRGETGTGMSGFYAQTLAEELNVLPEQITLLMGDTDRTPDGGYSAGFLTGAENIRKVGAYTYQALLTLAGKHFGVPADTLKVTAGVVTANAGKSISYGDLLRGQQLELRIPVSGRPTRIDSNISWGVAGLQGYLVEGKPPLKPMRDYQFVGKNFPMPGIPDKVTGRTVWSCDVPPDLDRSLLHARMVRPATLGSTLVAAGTCDRKRFPTAKVIRQGNLLAVVSPNEWEAISAARAVAATTKWTDWQGLPGSENLTRTLREHPWGPPNAKRGDPEKVAAARAQGERTLASSFEQPYIRHAPIGPFVAVADVREDGITTIWTHSSHSQGLRAQLAYALSLPFERVVVRWLDHAGQYGRTTHSGDGAEADAAILSRLTGQAVRVQWSLQEDLAWSSASPAWVGDVEGVLAGGRLTAVKLASYTPHMFDARLLGSILAGLPTITPKPQNWTAIEWPYDRIENRYEEAYGRANVAVEAAGGGLRGNIFRTPGHRQQNLLLESLINEAAAAAKADPIQFRLDHTTAPRLHELLAATAKAANWELRPFPQAATVGETLTGRGVGIMLRDRAYWVGIAEVRITPATGVVQVTRFTIGADCGKVINPRQLDRCMRGGLVMGLSETLKEEVTFDRSRVTSTDWSRYKILTMAETPEIRVVQISREDSGFGVGGEAANAVAAPAVTAAFFDATGIFPRRIPLTPAYVKSLLAR